MTFSKPPELALRKYLSASKCGGQRRSIFEAQFATIGPQKSTALAIADRISSKVSDGREGSDRTFREIDTPRPTPPPPL